MNVTGSIADALVERRNRIGMSIYRLVKISGVPFNTIKGIEKGEYCSLRTLERITDALGLDIKVVEKKEGQKDK